MSSTSSSGQSISIRGKQYPVLECRHIGRRRYYLLQRIGSPQRERFKAFDPLAGPGGDFFQVQHWQGKAAADNLRRLLRLKCDGFPRVYDCQQTNGGYSVALTWVEGIDLAAYFEHIRANRRPAVAPADALRLIRGLAHAVSRLNSQLRLCHGDIQPANVVITSHPSRLLLVDFGSAWICEAATSRTAGDGAHPCYCAPEQFRSPAAGGFHADQFSVSILLYQLLSGELPYQGLGAKAGWPEFAVVARQPVPPSELNPHCRVLPVTLRRQLDQVVLRGMHLLPSDRYPDRHAWLDAIDELHLGLRRPARPSSANGWLTTIAQWFSRAKTTS